MSSRLRFCLQLAFCSDHWRCPYNGDFKAHDALRYSSLNDGAAATRGADIVEALANTALVVINLNTPTRVPPSGPTSSPDITITNSHLGVNASWLPLTTLNSDHLIILVDLDGWFAEPSKVVASSYTNVRKNQLGPFHFIIRKFLQKTPSSHVLHQR